MGDIALLLLHFSVLFLLSVYGFHRYRLAWIALSKRHESTVELPFITDEELPRVTVQLPVFNERYVVQRLIDAICNLTYPMENWKYRFWTTLPMTREPLHKKAVKVAEKGQEYTAYSQSGSNRLQGGALEAGTCGVGRNHCRL